MLELQRKMRAKIAHAIAEDKRCRYPGVTEGVYDLAALEPFSAMDPAAGIPTIRAVDYNGNPAEFARIRNDAEFFARLSNAASPLATLPYKKLGVCLAGGAASALTMRPNGIGTRSEKGTKSYSDFDLFLVSHESDDAATAAVRAIGVHLGEWVANTSGYSPLEVYRTQGCITFYTAKQRGRRGFKSLTVQVVLRRYATPAEVIHSFDLGSSAFLWDGSRVFMTAMGKLAAEHGINVLNLEARRASYEKRLVRYFDRGYSIVAPRLDVEALVELHGELPHLHVLLTPGAKPNTVVNTVDARGLYALNGGLRIIESSNYELGTVPYGRPAQLSAYNLRAIQLNGVVVAGLCARELWSKALDITAIQPVISHQHTENQILGVLYFRGGGINIRRAAALLGIEHAMVLAREIAEHGEVSDQTRAAVAAKMASHPRLEIPFEYMRVLADTALVAPYNRKVISDAEWYGLALYGALYTALPPVTGTSIKGVDDDGDV